MKTRSALVLIAALLLAGRTPVPGQSEPSPAEDAILEYCERVKTTPPADVEANWALGSWCRENGLEEQAKKAFERVVALDPDHRGAREALGYVRYGTGWIEREKLAALSRAPERSGSGTSTSGDSASTGSGSATAASGAPRADTTPGASGPPSGSGTDASASKVAAGPSDAEVILEKKKWAEQAAEAFKFPFVTYEDEDFLVHTTYGSTREPPVRAFLQHLRGIKTAVGRFLGSRGSIWPQKVQYVLLRAREEYIRFAELIDGVRNATGVEGGYTAERGHTVLWQPTSLVAAQRLAETAFDRLHGSDRFVGWWLREGFAEFLMAYLVSQRKDEDAGNLFATGYEYAWDYMRAEGDNVTIYTLLHTAANEGRSRERGRALAMTLVDFMIRKSSRSFRDLVATLKSEKAPEPPSREASDEEVESFYLSYISFQEAAVEEAYGSLSRLQAAWKQYVEKKAAALAPDPNPGGTQGGSRGGRRPRGR